MKKNFLPLLIVSSVFFFLLQNCATGPLEDTLNEATVTSTSGVISSTISVDAAFTATFNAPVDTSTVTTSAFFIVPNPDADISASFSKAAWNGTVCNTNNALASSISCNSNALSCTNTPDSSLDYSTPYMICLSSSISFQNQKLNGLFSGISESFITEANTADETAPSVSNKALTASNASTSSIDISWNAASDNSAAANTLLYLVYYSTTADLDSVSDIETNGTAFGTYATGITSKSVTGLTANTAYTFNVIVKDPSGNKALYTATSESTLNDADETAPNIGADITFSNLSAIGVKVNWGVASDDESAESALQYKLVRASTSAAIDTVSEADAITGSDLIMNWTANTTTKYAFEPSDGTSYFAVLVKDEAGNKALYAPDQTSAIPNSSRIGMIPLSDNGFILMYRDDDDSNALKSIVFDSAGDYTAGPTTVDDTNNADSDSWANIRGIHHSNGSVVVSYTATDSDGYFVELDTNGEVTSGPTEFLNADVWFNDIAEVGSSDRLLFGYGDNGSAQRSYARIYDMGSDDWVTTATLENSFEKRGGATCTFGNGNAVDFFVAHWSGRDPYFIIYNDSQTQVKTVTLVEGSVNVQENVMDCISLSNGNVATFYNNQVSSSIGKMAVIENDGDFALEATTIVDDSIADIAAEQLSTGNIFVAYRNASDGNSGYYKVIDVGGDEVVAATQFKDVAVGQIELAPLADGKIAVTYHVSSTSIRELQIIDPS